MALNIISLIKRLQQLNQNNDLILSENVYDSSVNKAVFHWKPTPQGLGNDISLLYEGSSEKGNTPYPVTPGFFPSKDYFGLLPSSNACDSEELTISHTSPMVHDLATPVVLMSNDGEANRTVFDFDNNFLCNGTPVINDFATPVVSCHLPGSNASNVAESEEPSLQSLESNDEASGDDDIDDLTKLKIIRLSNVNRLVIGQININSLRNKFDSLTDIV